MALVPSGKAFLLLQELVERVGVFAVYLQLLEPRELCSVCELAGITNIRTKSLGSNNKQNVVLATIEALSQLRSPEEVARLRGKSVEEILG